MRRSRLRERSRVRGYLVKGAPCGATVHGLAEYGRARSPSWRAVSTHGTREVIEKALTRRFLTEGLCRIDGSLSSVVSQ